MRVRMRNSFEKNFEQKGKKMFHCFCESALFSAFQPLFFFLGCMCVYICVYVCVTMFLTMISADGAIRNSISLVCRSVFLISFSLFFSHLNRIKLNGFILFMLILAIRLSTPIAINFVIFFFSFFRTQKQLKL